MPKGDLRLGMVDDAIGGRMRRPMDLPDASIVAVPVDQPGATDAGALDQVGAYLREVMRRTEDDRNFRIFCPDELESNKLGAVLEVTGRAHLWSDEADSRFTPDGRVVEVLAEHLCEGFLEGYLKTGRHALFPCYEAFIQIVDSQIAQYAKWLKVSNEIPVAAAPRVAQHPAHVGRMAPGPQRLLAPEPGLHQQPAHQEGHGPADHAAARCEHAQRDRRALPALHRLHQPGHRHEAAAAAVAVDGRGQGPCRRGRLDLALGVERRGASTPTS